MPTLQPGVVVTAKTVAAVLLAAIALAGAAAVRSAIGAGTSSYTNPTTQVGDLVVGIADGGVARLGAAGASDAAVLALLNGSPQWVDPGVTAAQITDSSASGRSVLTGTPAQGRTALGLGTPTTLAAQAQLAALLRRGPLALRTAGAAGIASGTTSSTTPMLAHGSTWVVVAYASQAGGFASSYLLFSGVNATRGYFIAVSSVDGGDDLLVRSMAGTGNVDTFLTGFVSTIGWHAIAFAVAADGNSVRYSIDGAAVTTATPATTPWPITSRLTTDPVYVGTDNATTGTSVGVAYLAAWSSVLADGDLVTLSSSPSAGAPALPSAPAWEWAAAAYAGAQRVTLVGGDYAVTGSPQVWMP